MGEPAKNRNISNYYGGRIYSTFSIHEGCLTFCDSYEVDLICNLT